MTLVYTASRVYHDSTSTGTGTVNLGAAVSGFRSAANAVSNGEFASGAKVYYTIEDGNDFEEGVGTYTAGAPDTISRDTVLFSSNAGSKISLSGSARIFLSPPGARLPLLDSAQQLLVPTQAALSAYITSTLSNVTGSNTQYTIVGWTEEYDVGGAFNASTGVYTAGVTGVHHVCGALSLSGLAAGVEGQFWLQTSTTRRYYLNGVAEPAGVTDPYYLPFAGDVRLAAAETFTLRLQLSGIGSDTVDILGFLAGTDRRSWMACRLTNALGA